MLENAATKVPAYSRWLSRHNIDYRDIKDLDNFKTIPEVDKNNYLYLNSFNDLVHTDLLPPTLYSSSGSSGRPTYWFRDRNEIEVGSKVHHRIISDTFGIKQSEKTLIVNCFAMGVWVAGMYTADSFFEISRQGFNLVTISPGIVKEDAINILLDVAPKFDNCILTGYPPFIVDLINEAKAHGVDFESLNTRLILAGDKFTEEFRESVLKKMGYGIESRHRVVGVYGSADAAVIGYETKLSIDLSLFLTNNNLTLNSNEVNSNNQRPAIFQYDTNEIFLEENEKNELLITKETAAPLVRYNIKDKASIISSHEMQKTIENHANIDSSIVHELRQNNLPFIVHHGRNDIAVSFYAINIYPENLKSAIKNSFVADRLTGGFFAYLMFDSGHTEQKLVIEIETESKITESLNDIAEEISENLCQVNSEYNKLRSDIGQRAVPVVKLVSIGEFSAGNTSSGLINIEGKKPKIIIKDR